MRINKTRYREVMSASLLVIIPALSQTPDTSKTSLLKKKDSIISITKQDTAGKLPEITMQAYRSAPRRNKSVGVHINASPSGDIRYDPIPTRNMGSVSEEIRIFPELPFELLKEPVAERKVLKNRDYILPTHEEYEILKTLWLKEDVMDTTIYSCLDSSLNLTMSTLNQILNEMTKKNLVTRRLVSPRLEFNAFGVPVEMSRINLKNKVYYYHSSVDQTKLKSFINAAAYEVKQDSGRLKNHKLRAAHQNKNLLDSLNKKVLIE
ncbi:hypothetical protein JW835_10790 [bacterium]|nr:hypothetical protein [bacterium]